MKTELSQMSSASYAPLKYPITFNSLMYNSKNNKIHLK